MRWILTANNKDVVVDMQGQDIPMRWLKAAGAILLNVRSDEIFAEPLPEDENTVFLVWECDHRYDPPEKSLHLVFSNEEQAIAEAQRQGKAAYNRETRYDGWSYTTFDVEEWDLIAEVVE